jgi:hypothetical protein
MLTTLQVKTETRDRLKSIGKKGESYDAIINRLLDNKTKVRTPLSSVATVSQPP